MTGTADNNRSTSPAVSDAVQLWIDDSSSGEAPITGAYRKYIFRKIIFVVICIGLAFVVSGISLTQGPYDIGFWETYAIIWDHITGNIDNSIKDYIIWEVRLPRIVAGLVAGAGLAIAGATMQSVLKNPLADPYTTGISSGALFGATLSITMGFTIATGNYGTVINAFVFSLIPMIVIVIVSKMKSSSPTTMIMAGIAVMYIFNAFTTVMKLWSEPSALSDLYRWQVGTLVNMTWADLPLMTSFVLSGMVIVQFASRKLNVIAMGDDSAKSLGVNAENLRIICLVVIALMTASIVSFTGLIGFVGLVVPHIVRLFIGSDNRYLIPASMMFGAAFLVMADLIGRAMFPFTLEVGVITAFIGGPMFLYLIMKRKNYTW